MFNCYSGSGVAAGQAPRLHFPCSSPATLPPPLLSPFPAPFPATRDLFRPSACSPSPPPATTLASLLLGLSAAVSINLALSDPLHGVRSPRARRYFRPKLRFAVYGAEALTLVLRFHFAEHRQGSVWTCAKNPCTASRFPRVDYWLSTGRGCTIRGVYRATISIRCFAFQVSQFFPPFSSLFSHG